MSQPLSLPALLRRHAAYYAGALVLFAFGALGLARLPKGELILWFSERRSPALDAFFVWATRLAEEPFFILVMLLLLGWRYRYALLVPALGLLVLLVSLLAKEYFQSPRPAAVFHAEGVLEQMSVVAGVHLHTGNNSFPSGHSMGGFALFTALALMGRGLWWQGFCLLGALAVALSRIYLVQHFLLDAWVGSLMGLVLGTLLFYGQSHLGRREGHWLDDRLRWRR